MREFSVMLSLSYLIDAKVGEEESHLILNVAVAVAVVEACINVQFASNRV